MESRRPHNFKHGESGNHSGRPATREYQAWNNMIRRCYCTKWGKYDQYGGRGIAVCKRWHNNYLSFLQDMGRCPPHFTLERIDVNGNYTPKNCCWASQSDQLRNRRPRTHCMRGHEFTTENTHRTTRGTKECKLCRRQCELRRLAKEQEQRWQKRQQKRQQLLDGMKNYLA